MDLQHILRPYLVFASMPLMNPKSQVKFLNSPYTLLIRLSLLLALVGGFGLGLYMLLGLSFGVPLMGMVPALMQVHGHVQLVGFIALFILAAGSRLAPSVFTTRLQEPALLATAAMYLAVGVALRAVAQPMPLVAARPLWLILSGILELAGALLALYSFQRTVGWERIKRLHKHVFLLTSTIVLAVALALILNLAATAELARGSSVVRHDLDEALLHLGLWGFAATVVLAVGRRLFPRFLFLRPTRQRLMGYALAFWALGGITVPAAWLIYPNSSAARVPGLLAQLAGTVMYLAALRLYSAPLRDSGRPKITNPTRNWARVAFGFLAGAAALNLGLSGYEAMGGFVGVGAVSATRHMLAQGFLLPVIVFMAARLLPGYASLMVQRPRTLGIMVWCLFLAALLRTFGELLGGYWWPWNIAAMLGGTLATSVFIVFALMVWRTSGRR